MNLKLTYLFVMMALTGCTEFAMLSSGAGLAVSQNAYVRAYNGVEVLTIINTEKDIKTHTPQNVQHDDQ